LLFQGLGTCSLCGRVLLVGRGLPHRSFPGLAELTLVLTPFLLSLGQLCLQRLGVQAGTIDFLVRTIFDGSRMVCKRLPLSGRINDLTCQTLREFGAIAFQGIDARPYCIAFLGQIFDLGSLILDKLLRLGLTGLRQ
jgi:hypothetical protein